MVESKNGHNKLTPLAPQQTEGVIKGFLSNGAPLFDWDQFQKLTKDLPPNTRIADILKSLKKQNNNLQNLIFRFTSSFDKLQPSSRLRLASRTSLLNRR